MTTANPYQVPQSNVDYQGQDDYSEVKVLSVRGRIGRLRYLGYSMGYSMLIYLAFAVAGFVLVSMGLTKERYTGLLLIAYIPIIALSLMLTIQRAHDFNTTGWLALLMFVPLANLIFMFIPGTDGENRFGKKTPPNRGALLIVLIIIAIVFIGIVAAVAIQTYQGIVHKAQAAAQNNLPAPAARPE